MCKRSITKIDNPDFDRIVGFNHDIFWFKVSMYDIHLMKSGQCFKQLYGNFANSL